ncbi:Polycomb group RING finger protein 5, partial [Datura stramonium]|nr:Polycomb group RING finger protein 5 [Datura stramonium]
DVNMPASYIKRYLAKKLSIQNEDKVEVRMLGMPIYPASPLHHLTDLWLRATPITEKKIKIGNSAKDFVMVLKYARSQKP